MILFIFGFSGSRSANPDANLTFFKDIVDPKDTITRSAYLWTVTIISRTVPISILSEYGVVDLDLGRLHSLLRLPAPVGRGGPGQRAQTTATWRGSTSTTLGALSATHAVLCRRRGQPPSSILRRVPSTADRRRLATGAMVVR